MKIKILLIVGLALCFTGSMAFADTFQGSAGGTFAGIGTVVVNNSPPPFWDNPSMDGTPPGNVGQILSLGTTPATPGLPVPNLQFWSIGGLVDNNVVFNGIGGGQGETLILTIAGNATSNKLFAYNTANVAQTTLLFDGTAGDHVAIGGAPITKSINIPYAQYGFELVGPGGTFFSGNGAGTTSSDANSNFAFFRNSAESAAWYVGVEDLTDGSKGSANKTGIEGLGDYNDMIFKVSTVPLPGALLLLGSGLVGLAAYGRRRRN